MTPWSSLRLASLLLLVSLLGCRVLFWHDERTWTSGRWDGESTFFEMEQRFQSKAHWFALNQGTITRNYRTVILRHDFQGAERAGREIASFPGWALENSLYRLGDRLVLIRGTTDELGGRPRELVSLPAGGGGNARPEVLVHPPDLLLGAFPSPDGKALAILTTSATLQKPTGEVSVDLRPWQEGRLGAGRVVRLAWSGAPGVPNVAWSPDGAQFLVHTAKVVQQVARATGSMTVARSFPKCWLQSTSNVSESGRAFFRVDRSGQIELRAAEGWNDSGRKLWIADIKRIGEGCP